MLTTPFQRHQAFDQEAIEAMSLAFEYACRALDLADCDDPFNEMVAKQVIEMAQQGIRTPTALYLATMLEFKTNAH
jgi:hypothetical protein